MLSNEEFKKGVLLKAQQKERQRRRKIRIVTAVAIPCIFVSLATTVVAVNFTTFLFHPMGSSKTSFGTAMSNDDLNEETLFADEENGETLFVDEENIESDGECLTGSANSQSSSKFGISVFADNFFDAEYVTVIDDRSELYKYLDSISPNSEELYKTLCDGLDENYVVCTVISGDTQYLFADLKIDEQSITVYAKQAEQANVEKGTSYILTFVPRTEYHDQQIISKIIY